MKQISKQSSPVTSTGRNGRTTPPIDRERRQSHDEKLSEQSRRIPDKQQKEFGIWLQEVRGKAGRTQEQCCDEMKKEPHNLIMAKSDWSRVENGHLLLPNLYDKIPAMATAARVSPLLMYQRAYLKPPLGMEDAEASSPTVELASTEWERRAQYLEKLFVFCTNRILTALENPEISIQDLSHLRPTAEELEVLRATNEELLEGKENSNTA